MGLEQTDTVEKVDLLDALETQDVLLLQTILKDLGFSKGRYYVAVSIGKRKLPFAPEEAVSVELGRKQYGYLSENPFQKDELEDWRRQTGSLGVGYSRKPADAASLSGAFETSLVCSCQFFVDPAFCICTEEEIAESGRADELLRMISKSIEKGRWNAVCGQLSMIRGRHRSLFSVCTSMKLCNMIYSGSIFCGEKPDYYIYNIRQLLAKYKDLDTMLDCLKNAILDALCLPESEDLYATTAFMRLLIYVEEHYREPITLSGVGEALHMSPNYVSQLFKKESGVTLIHYVTRLRMEEAILLLSSTDLPVIEISRLVGFHDYFYFLKTFKKFTQKTPTQYREQEFI